ncbi:MAG TPA: TrkA C-terminal domain-containing protein [Acidimicrobiales bacterium]
MDDRPRNLKTMLAEAKDTSELMVDLAYGSLYFSDPEMAEGVFELEERLSDLVHDMRGVCVVAVRSPKESDGMSSVLQVISAIERIGNNAVDIGRIVTKQLGIPQDLVADLHQADEVSHRVIVRDHSELAHRRLDDVELPVEIGMRVVAYRRAGSWETDVRGDTVIVPDDVLFVHGTPAGIDDLRRLAGAEPFIPPVPAEEPAASDLDRAIDTLVEMKNLSETAVGLAYSALVLREPRLAAEVVHLEDRLDEMKERIETWVLRAAADQIDPSPLRGLLHLAQAAEDLGDQAQQMVWLIEQGEDLHPVLSLALGDADEVVAWVPVAEGSAADGRSLRELRFDVDPGFHILAIRRQGRHVYRPRGRVVLRAGDELIATGPDEGHALLTERCGWRLDLDDATGEHALVGLDDPDQM